MIVFLTLIYVALLALMVKLNIVNLNLFWKLSPLLWMLLLFLVLFVPMQWAAPSGTVNVYQNVVEIIPNVSGEVIEVPGQGMSSMEKGDVLFKIDPEPFQIQVDAALVGMEDAKQKVEQLKAAADSADATVSKTRQDIDVLKAEQANAAAAIISAEATVRESEANQQRAISVVDDLTFQVDTAQKELTRKKQLLGSNAVSQSEVDLTQIQFTGLEAKLNTATIDAKASAEAIIRSKANLEVAKTNAVELEIRMKQLVESELARVTFNAKQARLAAEANIGGEHTLIAAAKAKLQQARFDLEQTTVKAPAKGYTIGVTLRPGQRVGNMPFRSWMSFVNQEAVNIVVGVNQYTMRKVKPGQAAEVTFKMYPGKIFTATVDRIAAINPEGQLSPSGIVPDAPGAGQAAIPYGVILKMDPSEDLDVSQLPGGAAGTAAIYTESAKPTHVIRKVMIRMQAWQNYVIP